MGRATGWRAPTACVILVMAVMAVVATQAAAVGATSRAAHTERALHIVTEAAEYDSETGIVNFTVEFDRRPDFRTVDEFGRAADSFQYFITGDATLPYPQNFDAIVRGDEIDLKSRLLPIRNPAPSDSNPAAGGWGTIRATAPYHLRGRVLTFAAPLEAVSGHSTDGRFTYTLETYHFGVLVDSVVSESVMP